MAKTGVSRIDALLSGVGAPPLVPGDGDAAAVGLVQELLRAQGFSRLPDAREETFGRFGPLTKECVLAYRSKAGLPAAPQVDGALIADLARRPAANPLAARGYLTLVLDLPFTPILGLVALTTLFESGGRFACLNLNTDRCGLSFGIIQWAQRPGRLAELIEIFHKSQPEVLEAVPGSADGLRRHLRRPNGGVDPNTGRTVDPAFDLIADPWRTRFENMGKNPALQRVQVEAATSAFRASLAKLRPDVPGLGTQRGCAFLLDLANQHGDGGARAIYRAVARDGMSEAELIDAMERESVRRVGAQYGPDSDEAAATADRRRFFRMTPWLSDAAAAVA